MICLRMEHEEISSDVGHLKTPELCALHLCRCRLGAARLAARQRPGSSSSSRAWLGRLAQRGRLAAWEACSALTQLC